MAGMREQLLNIFALLMERYGHRAWWPADTPFEVCVGAILTQNTNWGNVEKAIANLKQAGLLEPGQLHAVPRERLAEAIRPAGFFNLKSERLSIFVDWLYQRADGDLARLFANDWQQLRDELLALKGIGPETADSILLYAGHHPTFVVDAYTRRLFPRLGLVDERAGYEEVRTFFMANLPADVRLFNEYHALIVEHCKTHCRKTPRCGGCLLGDGNACAFAATARE
jgi:endonuclease-3 related protein